MSREHRVASTRRIIPVLMACSLWCLAEDPLPSKEEAAAYFQGIDSFSFRSWEERSAMMDRIGAPWEAIARLAEAALSEAIAALPPECVVGPIEAHQATYSIPRGGVLDTCLTCAFFAGGCTTKPKCRQIICAIYDDVKRPIPDGAALADCFPILGQFQRELGAISRDRKNHELNLREGGSDVWAQAPLVRAMTEDWRSFVPEAPPPVLDVPPERLPALCDRMLQDPAIGPHLPPRAIDLLSADPKRRDRAFAAVTRRHDFLVQWSMDEYFPSDPKDAYKVVKCWGREYAVLENMPFMRIAGNPSAWSVVVNRLWESACWHYQPYDTRNLSGRANRSAVEEHFPVVVWLFRHKEPSDETLLGEIAHPRDALRGQLAAWMLCMTHPKEVGLSTFMTERRIEWGRNLIDAYLAGHADLTAEEKSNLETAKTHLSDMAVPTQWDWLPSLPK